MNDSRNTWNGRWRERAERPFEPDSWLLKVRHLLPAGRALDIASGRGRNALFLAEQGVAVTAFDISEEALDQLKLEAARRQLAIETQRVDLEADPRLPVDAFDLVIDFFYLYRPLLPHLLTSVRPGGIAVLRTFSSAGPFPGGPSNSAFILQPGELLEIFAGWDVLLHEEGIEPSHKGGSLAGIVARRPGRVP
jgi:tellurite methyltransferase